MKPVQGDDSNEFNPRSTADWRSLCTSRYNVLLEGPESATNAVLLLVEPHLPASFYWKRPKAPLELPNGDVGAVILQDVSDLGAEEQARLFRWLDDQTRPRTQIVSTTAEPLFALVAQELFDERLYYRLNVILLRA